MKIPHFKSDAEAAAWHYEHRNDQLPVQRLSAADIQWLFGDVDPESLEDIVQPE